ncbi:MAG TPA: TolC family protein, partial [Desulfobacterales bacterium]|nr:TolC family protein [Desulfobacterales bacterium]
MRCFHGILCDTQIILTPIFLFCLLLKTSLVLATPSSANEGVELVLDLNQIIDRARSSNRHLLQSGLLVQKNRYSLQSTESEFDWQVRPVANLGYSKSDSFSEQATGISGRISKKSSFGVETAFSPSVAYVDNDGISSGVGVSLTIPLFRGFGKEYNYDSIYTADFALESSIRNVYLAEVEKIIETVSLAYEVVRQQTLIDLYGEQDRRLNKHVVTIQLMETTGLGSQIDTYRAQIRQKDVQNQLANARQQYQAALDRLKVLLALPVETQLKIKIPLSYELTKIKNKEAEEIALLNRLEIDQAKADLAEARRKAKVTKIRILPDLNFVATYRKNSFLENIDASESNFGDYWSVGFTSNTDVARSSEKAS